ncbi:MAG: prepilin-type N-terminal cleavage/methylation domain-containing protein [Campylobacteraceae bacterium]|jgi:prepilin-type N-terminal cleavage/methylation domain-containing protein|nr:prepilin-type N-terminal cleavage/methylation domain-containing protein [Campylobacteraceae bacterium]
MANRAFSLIELVISIVVIGIVSASFPLILSQTSNNVAFAMQQEAILATKTYMGTILSYPWDENSIFNDGSGDEGIILNVDTGDTNLKGAMVSLLDNATALRAGHILGDKRRKMKLDGGAFIKPCFGNANCSSVSGFSMEAFNGKAQNLSVVDGTKNIDSTLRFILMPTVSYIDDDLDSGDYSNTENITFKFNRSATGITNIKRVVITASSTNPGDPEVNMTFRAYSSNIGEFQLLSKAYL